MITNSDPDGQLDELRKLCDEKIIVSGCLRDGSPFAGKVDRIYDHLLVLENGSTITRILRENIGSLSHNFSRPREFVRC